MELPSEDLPQPEAVALFPTKASLAWEREGRRMVAMSASGCDLECKF